MFASRSGNQFSGPKTKPILGVENEARNGFPLRAANQAGAILGPVLGPHFGLRFGTNLDLGLEFQTGSQAARGRKKEVSSCMQGSLNFSLKCNTVWIRRLQG